MIPIASTQSAITRLARSFRQAPRYDIEVFGYWIGMVSDRLTHAILPDYLIGISRDETGALGYLTNTRCRSRVMFAAETVCNQLGIMIHTCPEAGGGDLAESSWIFIPVELLVLNRPIAAYMPVETIEEHFPGIPPYRISTKDIAAIICASKNRKQTHLLDKKNRWTRYHFLPSLGVRVDAFVTNSRIYPMNQFILNALEMNQFTRQHNGRARTIYGRVHIHYAYRRGEIVGDALINALHKNDKYFFELMTPMDAISMLDSTKAIREISDGRLTMTQQIEAIVALDPESFEVVGRSYFDLQALKSTAAIDRFKSLAGKAGQSRDITSHIQWFDYIRDFSTPTLNEIEPADRCHAQEPG